MSITSYGTTTTFSNSSGLNSLASGSTVSLGVIDNTTELADEYFVELVIADIAETGNKQVIVYARSSVDGTNYSDTGATNLRMLGIVDLDGLTGPTRSIALPVSPQFGGFVPPKVEVYAKNDAGVTLASSGNSAQYRSVK